MNQLITDGIILSRTNYGEADRIIKLLTPANGKISLIARGVRKPKSKLAGGIELFSVSGITYIKGRGELGTLVSARLDKHYGKIVKNIDRVQLGYELIKALDRATEDEPEAEYFELLQQVFEALNDDSIDVALVRFWFNVQLVKLSGHSPNLHTDATGAKLSADLRYTFDFDNVSFAEHPEGQFTPDHIKFLRLAFAGGSPKLLQQVTGVPKLLPIVMPLVQTMLTSYIRV
ncbi:MAG: repair protein RecO [Candidatus Saccharibacteria bacterium]|nr:repair protein RecO [Candidatus Saccharibacteria bacterium]